MVTQELLDTIIEKYKHGMRRDDIVQSLVERGYTESDIYEAIRHIQKQALLQLPFVAKIHAFIQSWDNRTSQWSLARILAALGGMALIVFLIALLLVVTYDPFGLRAGGRDRQRDEDFANLQHALSMYHAQSGLYPQSLQQLVPTYLKTVPSDPKTHALYSYSLVDEQGDYQLCINFETKPPQCVSSGQSSSIPTISPASQ